MELTDTYIVEVRLAIESNYAGSLHEGLMILDHASSDDWKDKHANELSDLVDAIKARKTQNVLDRCTEDAIEYVMCADCKTEFSGIDIADKPVCHACALKGWTSNRESKELTGVKRCNWHRRIESKEPK